MTLALSLAFVDRVNTIVRSSVERRLSLYTKRLTTQTVNTLWQEGPRLKHRPKKLRAPWQESNRRLFLSSSPLTLKFKSRFHVGDICKWYTGSWYTPKRSRHRSDSSFSIDKPRLFDSWNRGGKTYAHTILGLVIDYWKHTIEVKWNSIFLCFSSSKKNFRGSSLVLLCWRSYRQGELIFLCYSTLDRDWCLLTQRSVIVCMERTRLLKSKFSLPFLIHFFKKGLLFVSFFFYYIYRSTSNIWKEIKRIMSSVSGIGPWHFFVIWWLNKEKWFF